MFKKLLGMFSNDLAIDLGTANTLVLVKDKVSVSMNHLWSPYNMTNMVSSVFWP